MNDKNGSEWYVIYCKFRKESAAEQSLIAKGYEVYRPVIKNKKSDESLFPRYLFLRMADLAASFQDVQYTYGLSGFVRFADQYARTNNQTIEQIRRCEKFHNDKRAASELITKGDIVEVNGCGFDNLEATFQEHNKDKRVTVLLEILGRESKVSVPSSCVSKN